MYPGINVMIMRGWRNPYFWRLSGEGADGNFAVSFERIIKEKKMRLTKFIPVAVMTALAAMSCNPVEEIKPATEVAE